MAERDELAAQASKLLSPEIRRCQMLLAQREMAVKHAATIEEERKRLLSEVDQDRQKLARLQARISQRKETLKLARARLEVSKLSEIPAIEDSMQQLQSRWTVVHQKLQHSRHVLVSEVMSLFDLKCVPERRRRPLPPPVSTPQAPSSTSSSSGNHQHRQDNEKSSETSNMQVTSTTPSTTSTHRSGSTRLRVRDYLEEDSWNEYLIVGRPLPTGYFENYDRDEINTSIGNVVHMSTLIACYLGVKLPFLTYLRSFVYHIHPSLSASSRRTPLNLSETNLESFAMGLAMLNYNIAYLCYTQGVYIPLKKAPNTLENLLACCQSPNLGKYTQFASMMARKQQKQRKQEREGRSSHNLQNDESRLGLTQEQWDYEQPFDLDLFQLAHILRSRQEESSVWGGLQLHDAIAASDNYVDDYFLEEEDAEDLEDEGEDEDEDDAEGEETSDATKAGHLANNGHSRSENGTHASSTSSSSGSAKAGGTKAHRNRRERHSSPHQLPHPDQQQHHHHQQSSASTAENWTFLDVDLVRIPSASNYGTGLLGGRGWAAAVPGVVPSALKQIRQIGSAVSSKALGSR
ncbi:hypothetical protein BGW41_003159 [Actinomortierella wolfii]|nr:hypothetical protein BGW41_003159 [Actinomortierella wolfii]